MIARGALSLGALALGEKVQVTANQEKASAPAKFNHRGYLGWITDLASNPDPSAAWPSMRLDAQLLKDYQESFRGRCDGSGSTRSPFGAFMFPAPGRWTSQAPSHASVVRSSKS